ncbi:MAG: FtsX-like permease family protein [Terriglobia bacterium]
MERIASRFLAGRRFAVWLLVILAATALLLAAVGIYGVMSYAVTRRTHELGIRSPLGASRREIVGIVLRQGHAAGGHRNGLGAWWRPSYSLNSWQLCCAASARGRC